MKLNKLKIKSQWLATWLSVITLITSPVALGTEAEKISKQQAVEALKQMGLDKEITVGEFYKNTKDLYPERIRAQIEPVLMKYKNMKMPKFDVVTVKGSNGIDIPNIRAVTENEQLYNLQLFGIPEKYAKFQNTNLSEIDIINFDDMFVRINAGDQALRKQTEVASATNKSKFTEYPNVTRDSWLAMTPNERAGYMINLRLLWSDAKKVLTEVSNEKTKAKGKKTSYLLRSFLPNVEAAEKTETKNNNDCLVAGYVTSYRGVTCDHKQVRAEYKGFEIFNKASEFCSQKSQFACNPLVFGTPGGKPICIVPGKSKAFQEATHYSGPCETINMTGDNHLSTNVDFLKKDIYKGRYDSENLKGIDLEKNAKEFQGPNFKQTESFLDGILKFSGKNNLYTGDGKTINPEAIAEILAIKKVFQEDIDQATASCKASSNDRTTQERNFWKACDQLQRRFLFVAEFFQLQCKEDSKIDASTLKCVCPSTASVNPGASCKDAAAPAKPTDPNKPAEPPVAGKPPVGSVDDKCPAGQVQEIKKDETEENGGPAISVTCVPIKVAKKEPSFWDKLWKGASKYAPYLIIPVVAYAAYKLFSPKQPKRKSAGDSCPNGSKPPCGQACKAPLAAQGDGSCACAACPPGQSITAAATCTCGTMGSGSGTSGGTLLRCSDNVTYVTDLSLCPTMQYTCWDGSKVPNALNCPEKPATVVPKTGTQK